MTEYDDPGADTANAMKRAALLTASVVAERIARLRGQAADARAAADTVRAEDLQKTWHAQRETALSQVGVATDRWAQTAAPDEVAHAWGTAHAWALAEPELFRNDAIRLEKAVVDRFKVGPLAGRPEDLAPRLRAAADQARGEADGQDEAARVDEAVAATATGAGLSVDADEAREEATRSRSHAAAADRDAAALATEAGTVGRRERITERAKAAGVESNVATGVGRAADGNAKPVVAATQQKAAIGSAAARQRRARGAQRADQLGR